MATLIAATAFAAWVGPTRDPISHVTSAQATAPGDNPGAPSTSFRLPPITGATIPRLEPARHPASGTESSVADDAGDSGDDDQRVQQADTAPSSSTTLTTTASTATPEPQSSTTTAPATPTTATAPTTTAALPPIESSPSILELGSSSFDVDVGGGRDVAVWAYVPAANLSTASIVIAMHGASRNAEGARNAWKAAAEEYGLIIIAPRLSESLYPGDSYNLGGTLAGDQITPSSSWAFPIVERVFDHVVAATGSSQTTYVLYGHSAGAQFVERFALFWPSNRVSRFIAAGAGWHTMLDETIGFPYGLQGGPTSVSEAQAVVSTNLLLLLGELDTDPAADDLRQSTLAQAQGNNRLERGAAFYEHAASVASSLGAPFGWRFSVVAGAGHDNRPMVAAAAETFS